MTVDTGWAPRSFAFGPFVLVPERQSLREGDASVRIGGRALDLLTALVERPGEVVSKRQLMARAWPDVVVDEGNLKVNMAALRRALGDESSGAQYIATVTGRGYRFVAPVQANGTPALGAAAPGSGAGHGTGNDRRSHNLPTGTTRIFGREDAIDAIRHELEGSRIVSIVGHGGIGKTTVALAVARRAVDAFRDGVWLVDLALLKDPDLVPHAIATAIGAVAHLPSVQAAVCECLRDREALLVLDSCEHLIDAVASCANQILAEAAGVKVLVTSREPLMLNGERVRRLPRLATPPDGTRVSAEEALSFPAIQLFVDRATDRLGSFHLNDADAPLVAEICRRLDGLALAIELAATRIDAFGVSGLLKQLDDRFRLLAGRRAGPERHRTLAATLDWSYGLLPPREATLLRAVSVFAGVFDIDGAAAVSDTDRIEVADALAQLATKSLLAVDLDADGVAYRLLETTRADCLERLRASGEDGAVRQRHAERVCALLERATAEWAKRPAREWAQAYGRVLDDLRNALAWTRHDAANRRLRIRLTLAGILLWNHFSLTGECRAHASQAMDDYEAAGLAGTEFEMKLRLWLGGSTMFTRGLKPRALADMHRALHIAELIDDSDYRLRCLMMIGIYELFTGDHRAGLRTLQAFSEVAAASDPSVLPESEVHTGIAELFLGRLPSARQRLETLQQRDLRYFNGSYGVRYLSDTIVLVQSVLSHAQWLTGSPDAAARTAASAVANGRETHHHLSLNNALSYACPIFFWTGRFDECEQYVAMLEEQVKQQGIVARLPVALFYRAALAAEADVTSPDAVLALQRAIGAFRDVNHLARLPSYLSVLGQALLRRGRIGEAEVVLREARDVAAAQHESWCLPEVLRVQALAAVALGHSDQAEALLVESMQRAADVQALSWQLRSAMDLASLWHAAGRTPEARRMLRGVHGRFQEGFTTRDLRAAATLLLTLDAG